VRDPLEYPLTLDKIGGRTLACKIKLQQNWGNYSVTQAKGDDVIIEKIRQQFPKNEVLPDLFPNKEFHYLTTNNILIQICRRHPNWPLDHLKAPRYNSLRMFLRQV
jgi:hypothetical protein